MWSRVGLASAMLAVGMIGWPGASARAQNPPSFPRSLEREALLAWLQRETDITPERVVAVTSQAVTAVVSTFPAGGGQGPRVVIRAEALNGETHARTGALSWHVSLSADCQNRRVRLGDTTGYPERNLLGERRVLREAETEWRAPEPGTALDNAWRAACDPRFAGPFQSASLKVAQADAAAPPPPAAVAEAPSVAAPPPRTGPAPKPAPIARRAASGGPISVQVGAFADQGSANAALARLAAGQPHGTERAVVGGRTWYRAVVGGFASAEEASRFCAARLAQGGACLVRGKARN